MKRNEEAKEAFRKLINGMNDAVFIHDLEGNMLTVNDTAVERLGYSRTELLSMRPQDFDAPLYAEKVRERIQSIKEEDTLVFESVHVTKDGTEIPVEISSSLITYQGSPTILSVARDITERKEAEEELRKSEQEKSLILESSPAIIVYQNTDHEIIWANERAGQSVNQKSSDLIGGKCYEIWYQRKESCENCPIEKSWETGKIEREELETSEGRYWLITSAPTRNEEGAITGAVETTLNITERKEREKKLRASEKRLRRSQKVANVGSWEIDLESGALTWSDETYRIFGVSVDEPIDYDKFLRFTHPDDRAYVDKRGNKALKTGEYDIEHRILVDGETKWVREKADIRFDEGGEPIEVIGSVQDITERKRMEEEVRESRKKYRAIVEQTHDAIIIYRDERFLFVNEQVTEITGYSKEELYNMKTLELFPSDERDRIQTITRKRRTGEGAPSRYEARVLTKGGAIKHCEFAVTPITYEGAYAALVAIRNITKRKEYEEKLTTLHQWARRLNKANSMNEIFEHTLDAMEQTLGFKNAVISLKKGDSLKLTAARGFQAIPEKLRKLPLQGNGITVKTANTGTTMLVKNVAEHPDYLCVAPSIKSELAVPVKIGDQVLGVLDVESVETHAFNQQDQRLLETLASHVAVAIKEFQEKKKRVSLQRLEELRDQFLAMAAHEINTPLTPIKTNLEMLLRGYFGELTEEQTIHITQTLESVDRLMRLVSDFRRTSQLRTARISLDKKEQQIANTLKKALKQYKYTSDVEEITIIKKIEQPLTAVYDEDRMIQVFHNLIDNALDYTKDTIWIQGRAHDEHIEISVRDNGPGIPEDEQDKIFQPFYRVEEEARSRVDRRFGGTGLGLNICRQIVEAHGGEIHVDSTLGEGSTFTVTLPKT